ncbi:hypothetical protein JR338_09295 [Chloroflexota bacterium]|nr:hypothetical protein JR338_09295 [Chloroflexota bacterium]
MSEVPIRWFEIGFNVIYLIAVWYIVVLMSRSMDTVAPKDRKVAGLVRMAFILLAAGDTGHVGFRVLAYALGGLEAQAVVLGSPMSLIGLGMLTTSITVTLFYMILVYIWQARNNQAANWATNLLQIAGVVRLIIMALPSNDWGAAVPPQPMSLYRNLPLMVQGVGMIILFLLSAYRNHDTTFKWIGWMIAVSFAFYTPVILFAQQVPMLGLLMIPKTCAYLAIAIFAYRGLWSQDLGISKSPEKQPSTLES